MSLDHIAEPARHVPAVRRTDVPVVGSGPGGLAAAIAAARAGVKVTMAERFGCHGGNITVVAVEGLARYRHEATLEANGIGRKFKERARGLLVADRAGGGDVAARAATRTLAACAVAGPGAGVAAAEAAKSDRDMGMVDIKAVQQEPVRQRVRIP